MKEQPRRISVVTVTYNSENHVSKALDSARTAASTAGSELEIIVVDNASSDRSAELVRERYPDARLIMNAINVGFSRATNQGLALASGEHILLLNPDATLDTRALLELLRAKSALRAAAVAPSIGHRGAESAGMGPTVAAAAGHFLWLNRLFPRDRGGAWRGVQVRRRRGPPRRVEWASAAVLLLDREAIQAVRGFDERFFLYGEDIDLGLRLTSAGYSVFLVPSARADHLIAASQGGVSTGWVDALHDLHARSGGRFSVLAFDLIMCLGLSARAAIESARRGTIQAVRMRAAAQRAWWLVLASGGRPVGHAR